MLSARILRTIKWLIYITVVGTPLFYWKWSLYPYSASKTAFFQICVELLFALWIALAISDRKYRLRMTPLLWAIIAFLAALTITAFSGVDPWRSFFSDVERGFGIAAYFHLAALAVVFSSLSNELPWKKIWYASFGASLLTVLAAFIQLRIPDILLNNDAGSGRSGSFFGNPTFFAGYLLFNIFIAGYFLLRGKREGGRGILENIFLAATILGGVLGVFITQTRGDILGLLAGIFVLVVLFAFQPPVAAQGIWGRRKIYKIFVAILVVAAAGVWFTRTNPIWNNVPGLDRLKNLTFSGTSSDIEPRLIALNAGWQGFLERPILGWGFENFNVVFNTNFNPKILEYGYAESNFDKPHNIALELLDAGGIILFLAYLAVLILSVKESWRRAGESSLFGQVITALIVAYIIRSLVIFDTIGPVVMLYMVLGWVDGRYRQAKSAEAELQKTPKHQEKSVIKGPVLATSLVVAVIISYSLNGTAFAALYSTWDGINSMRALNDPRAGVSALNDSMQTWNVYQWDLIRTDANIMAQAYFYDKSSVPTSTLASAISLVEQVAHDHPNDAYNHYLLTDIYNLASDINPNEYLPKAEAQAQQAIALSPNRQEIYYYLSKTKTLEGDNAGALAVAKKALDLDPNVADSHFYYGMLAFANGQNALGYQEVKKAMALGRQWHDFYEPRVAADYFADSGHLAEAIQLYQAALKLNPQDLESEIKLGAAYYLNKQPDLARQYLSDAASKFDFKSSPVYAQYKPILDALGIQ